MRGPFSMLVDPQGDRPVAPPYREAYPALNVIGARRAWRDGQRVCEWHDERLELVARMELVRWTDTVLDITCEWVDDRERQRSRVMFDILHRLSLKDRLLPNAACPACRELVPTLYLVRGEWRCAGCHGLTTRATLLTPREKMLLQVRRLYAEVKGRAPPVRGFRTWDRKRLKLAMLMERLGKDEVAEMSEHVRAQVTACWVEHPFDAEEDDALTGLGYREPDKPVPVVMPWFG